MALAQSRAPVSAPPQPVVAAPTQDGASADNSLLADGFEAPAADTGSALSLASRGVAAAPPPTPEAAPPLTDAALRSYYTRNQGLTGKMSFQSGGALEGELAFFAQQWAAHRARYARVGAKTNLPAELVAAIHYREGSCDFSTYLHNGDPLGRPTVHVPAGILFSDWESAAIHALGMKKANQLDLGLTQGSTASASIATYAESYNGFGYANRGAVSAYVYAGTDQYKGGMYVADGVWSKSAKDGRPGVLACMNRIGFDFDSGMLSALGNGAQTGATTGPTAPATAVGGAPAAAVGGAPASGWTGSPLLRKGSAGEDVRWLQEQLKGLGYNVGTVDADFGVRTENALRAFQRRLGLEVDGVAGAATADALRRQSGTAANNRAAIVVTDRLLQPGTIGNDVFELQTALAARGYRVGAPDGEYGPATAAAVLAFQRASGLEADGVAGPMTLAALAGTDRAVAPSRPEAPVPAPTPVPTPIPGAVGGTAAERGALAARSARAEYADGVATYGAGASWEARGANQGTFVDKYQVANRDTAASDNAWCGMFVGFNFKQAGIRQEILDNLVFWSGYRLHLFFTQGRYLTPTAKAGDWWTAHPTVDLRGQSTTAGRLAALQRFNPRPGDVVLFRSDFSHVGQVDSFDPATGKLWVLEGNAGDRVQASVHDVGSNYISFVGRFNDADFGGPAAAALAARETPSIRFSDGSQGKTN